MTTGQVDVFLSYCGNSMQARTEVPALSIVPVPKALTVGADYGMIVLKGTSPSAGALAAFILSDAG